MPTIITGCTILRDKRGNPGQRIDHRREVSEAELDAYCRFLLKVAGKLVGDGCEVGAHRVALPQEKEV